MLSPLFGDAFLGLQAGHIEEGLEVLQLAVKLRLVVALHHLALAVASTGTPAHRQLRGLSRTVLAFQPAIVVLLLTLAHEQCHSVGYVAVAVARVAESFFAIEYR